MIRRVEFRRRRACCSGSTSADPTGRRRTSCFPVGLSGLDSDPIEKNQKKERKKKSVLS